MNRIRPFRAWLGFALLLFVVVVPIYGDTRSDIFALYSQAANAVAASGDAPRGETSSLGAKLVGAVQALQRGNDNVAVDKLNAFANEVRALEQSGRLSPADADALVNGANAIIAEIPAD